MIKPKPTLITLEQDDLKQYEEIRASWAPQADSANSSEKLKFSNIKEANNDSNIDRRSKINSKIGLSKP